MLHGQDCQDLVIFYVPWIRMFATATRRAANKDISFLTPCPGCALGTSRRSLLPPLRSHW